MIRQRTSAALVALLAPSLLLLAAVFILPSLQLVVYSFWRTVPGSSIPQPTFTLANYYHLLVEEGPYYIGIYLRTARIGLVATVFTLIAGYPLAWHIARQSGFGRGLLLVLVLLPMIGGAMIQTLGWIVLLMPYGVVNGALLGVGLIKAPIRFLGSDVGVIIGLVQSYIPMMVLPLVASFSAIDPSLPQAAKSLGASSPRAFFEIELPLTLPGAAAGAVLVFLSNLTSFVTPLFLGQGKVQVLGTIAYTQGIEIMNYPFASAFALFPLVLVGLAWFLGRWIARRIRQVGGWEVMKNEPKPVPVAN